MRGYSVYIDGIKVGKLRDGETRRFNVSVGHHSTRKVRK
jgi:hypothetical protein